MIKNLFRTCTMVGALAVLVACGENAVGPNGAIAPKGPLYNATVPFNDAGACMANDAVAAPTGTVDGVKLGDDPASALNCTSNDVAIAHADLIAFALFDPSTGNFGPSIPYTGQTVQCVEGDPIKLSLTAELDETATSSRTDIGVWIATDGGDAKTGLCNHYNLINGSQGVSTESGNLIPDSCGDLAAGAVVPAFPLGDITTICTAGDNSQLHVGSCLGWKEPGADQVCPLADADPNTAPNWTTDSPTGFRFGTLYGNKSKCNCDGFNVPVTVLQKAFLEVVKACDPTTDTGLFNLQIDGTTEAADAACGGTTGKKTVGAGTSDNPGESHSFAETAGTGTSLTNYTSTRTCVNRTGGAVRLASAAGTSGSVTLQPDDDVICTITNTRLASITITKVTSPASDPQDFAFTTTGSGLSNFSLDTDGSDNTLSNTITFNNLNPGSYSVTEGANPTGWDFTSLVCGTGGSVSGKVATITLAAGASVSCTYTNTKQGSITITKVTSPASDPQDFAFTTTGTGLSDFSLDTDGSDNTLSNTKTFSNLSVGSYSVTEGANPTGWDFTSLVCGTGGSVSGKVATITLAAGASVSCTYTNTKQGSITITKVTDPASDPQDFAFTTTGTGLSDFSLDTDGSDNTLSNTKTFSNLSVGSYSVTEGANPTGWDFTSLVCGTGGSVSGKVATITLAAGASVSCTYTNTKQGSITITKVTVPASDPQDFAFTTTGTGLSNFSLDTDGSDNTLSNTKTFSNVSAGSYSVTEGANPTGWDFTSLVCGTGGSASGKVATITLPAGGSVSCTYTNTKRASLVLAKVENGGLPLSRAWTFELRTGASTISAGTVVATASANVTTGVVTFPGTFTPGAYQLCETGMPVGYTNNITGFTPAGATPEGGDNSTECIDITLVSGSNGPGGITGVPNPIDNVAPPPPGGDARTIGYWKNWSSCTGGKQYVKAAARNELNKTLDFYLPTGSALYPIGDITGTPPLTCQQAVYLLGKSDMNTGKKSASDPAYNLAAQFIAARLNVAAGAGTCSAATTAIAAAQTLLDALNFTGTGSYKTMSAADAALANSLATTLDKYNNNTLCP